MTPIRIKKPGVTRFEAMGQSPFVLTVPAHPAGPVLYTIDDLEAATKLNRRAIKSYVDRGLLPRPTIRNGKTWLWPKEVWDAWAAKQARKV